MPESGPNVRFFWVAMNGDYSAAALVRSWREGRISAGDLFGANGSRLTFRQLCLSDPWLHSELGSLPNAPVPKKRSWFAERRFRRDAWRKVVEKGELGPALLAERIDRLSNEVKKLEERCAESDERLAAADRREKDLVAALRTGAEDAEELAAICKACEDARTDGLGADALGRSQAGILKKLIERLRMSFLALADGSSRIIRIPDAKHIEQIVLFHRKAQEETEAARQKISNERAFWTRDLEKRRNDVRGEAKKAKDSIGKERKVAEGQLAASIRDYRQTAVLHGQWRNEVSTAFLRKFSSGGRHQIGNVLSKRPDWLIQAIMSYAPTVAPESVLGLFRCGGLFSDARCGFLVAWDGLHWSMSTEDTPGFLPWGWTKRIKVVRGLFGLGADVELDGRSLSVWRAGSCNELEMFMKRVDDANRALPAPSLKNGGAESFHRISAHALAMIDSIASPSVGNSPTPRPKSPAT